MTAALTTTLTTPAPEGGTYGIVFTFDAEPNADLTWSLTDINGTEIHGRTDESVSVVDEGDGTYTATVVLSGDDLSLSEGVGVIRIVLLKGTYDSTLGTGLPIREQAKFSIEDFVAVT